MVFLLFVGGCSYMIPSSTNIEPSKTVLKERREIVKPPSQKTTNRKIIRIKRRPKRLKHKMRKGKRNEK